MVLFWDSPFQCIEPHLNFIDMAFWWTESVYNAKITPLTYRCWILCTDAFFWTASCFLKTCWNTQTLWFLKECFEYNIQETALWNNLREREVTGHQAHTLLRVSSNFFNLLLDWLGLLLGLALLILGPKWDLWSFLLRFSAWTAIPSVRLKTLKKDIIIIKAASSTNSALK